MEKEIKLDQYMICLDIDNDYADLDVIFWLNYLEKNIKGKIHIISYGTIKSKIQEKYSEEKFVWIFGLEKSYEMLRKYIEEQLEEDAIVIVGGERLALASAESDISPVESENMSSGLYLQEYEAWAKFSKTVDRLYEKYQTSISGLVFICNVDKIISDRICEELKDSKNMSISTAKKIKFVEETSDNATRVLHEIENKPLEEALEIINKDSEGMDLKDIIICKATAYYQNGNITKATEMLKSKYNSLSNEMKIFLANLYVLQDLKEEARKIFEEVYRDDKWENGLFELGIKAYENNEKYKKRYGEILEECISYQPENIFFIENYASFLVDQEKYKEAAAWFRKINKPYYELIARVNDLLGEKQTDIKIVEAYIFEIAEKHPELRNIALLKVAMYANKEGHYYNAYNLLKKADLQQVDSTTKEILKQKIAILKDIDKASKALGKLKPFRKERDNTILLEKRSDLLLECINYFSNIENGYFFWRELLECQQNNIWNMTLKKHVYECFKELGEVDFENMLSKSYIRNLKLSEKNLDCDTAIYCLRKSNCGEMPVEKFGCTREEIEQGSWRLIESQGTDIQRIWLRYYCSIGASVLKKNLQDATNYSLSIVEFNKLAKENHQELISALYLMSWANLQFRLGNHVEGIACILVSIRKLLKLNECIPIVEEGLNILSRYLAIYQKIYSQNEKRIIMENINILAEYNESLIPLCSVYSNSTAESVEFYENRVKKCENKDVAWLIDLANLIEIKKVNGQYDEAIKYIKENYSKVHNLIIQRRDIAAQLYHSWGALLLEKSNVENLLLGLEMLDKAIIQIKERRQVYHQEERSALAQELTEIIREYICFSGIYYMARDIDQEIKKKLKNGIMQKMSICIPLSIIEQKKYYMRNEVSEELNEKHRRLRHLKREYAVIVKNSKIESDNVQRIANEIQELTQELQQRHPYYMPLKNFEGTDWEKIKRSLKVGEVVYQYVLTKMAVVSILVTTEWIDIKTKFFDLKYDSPYESMRKYGEIMEISNSSDAKIRDACAIISEAVAEHLCEYVFNYETKNIYVIPDISKSIFPISAVQYKGTYLIDKVKKIINFIDYEQLLQSLNTNTGEIKIVNKVFGKGSDSSIRFINKWLEENTEKNMFNITNCSDDLREVIEKCNEWGNTLAIYGHGVREPASEVIEGAQSIEGERSMIQIKEILEQIDISNFILISCVGGTPNSSNPEISSGTWTSIFERFNGNIIVCRWSVPTEDTINMMEKIYDNLLNGKMDFGEALLDAQKKMKNTGKNQLSWAGVECWIN